MTRAQFLSRLKNGLAGLPDGEVADILADYDSHFSDGVAAGRSEDDVAASLGDPLRLARELRAEASLKRWERARTPKNFVSAGLALFALLALDFLVLLPFGISFLFMMGVSLFVLAILGSVGVGLMFSVFYHAGIGGFAAAMAGLAMLSGVIGMAAIILLILVGAMHLLSRYVRLHYRLLDKPLD
jgi:uncharacterized membrane protein